MCVVLLLLGAERKREVVLYGLGEVCLRQLYSRGGWCGCGVYDFRKIFYARRRERLAGGR